MEDTQQPQHDPNDPRAIAHARMLRWLKAIEDADTTSTMGMATPREVMSLSMTWMMLGGLATARGTKLMHSAMGGNQAGIQQECFHYGSATDKTSYGDDRPKPPRKRGPPREQLG